MSCEYPLSAFICATNSSAGTVFADFGRAAVSPFPFFACGRMPQFMSSGTGKTVCCCIISKIPRLKFIFLSLVSGIGKDGNSAVFQNFLCNPRCFVSGIHRYKLNFRKTVRYLVVYCVPCSTYRLHFQRLPQHPTQSRAYHRQYVLRTQTAAHVPPLQTFRSPGRFWTPFSQPFLLRNFPLFSSSSSSLTFLPSFSRSSDTSLRSCSSYTFAALATCSFWNFFLFADALICVPSIKIMLGSTIRLFSALFKICAKFLHSAPGKAFAKGITYRCEMGISSSRLYPKNQRYAIFTLYLLVRLT